MHGAFPCFNIPTLRQFGSVTDVSKIVHFGGHCPTKYSNNFTQCTLTNNKWLVVQEEYGFWESKAAMKHLQDAQNLQAYQVFRKARPSPL